MGGGPTNMQGMIRQAQKMQEDMQKLQEELEQREYDIQAGGGVVTLKINGKKEVLSLTVAPELVDPDDIETMTDIIIAAVNEGIKRVEDVSNTEMSKITGGMGLPGMF
jgi:DNA-binding YbaB/EbfC family protein